MQNIEKEMKAAHDKGKLLIKTETINNTIRITFQDNGPGIAKENLERIFDPFFTTRKLGEGTGLGLSVCHGIIAEHGGNIYAKNEPNNGAKFIIDLPIVTEPQQTKTAEVESYDSPKVTGAKILIVDDEQEILDLLSKVLTAEGHEVETANNARSALSLIKRKRYRLILSDIKMSKMSGIELYAEIQKIAKSMAKRVVFITGDITGTETKDFLQKAEVPYLTKPFDTNQFIQDINNILSKEG